MVFKPGIWSITDMREWRKLFILSGITELGMAQNNSVNELSVKSLRTTFQIIEELVRLQGATVTELAEHLDLAMSTTHDHLGTLCKLGYVVKKSEQYHISTHFLRLGERSRYDMEIYNISQPELENLAEQTGEYASLVIEESGETVIIGTEAGKNAVPLKVYNGIRMPIHTTASGKAIFAHLSEEHVEEILAQHGLEQITPNTVTDRETLIQELQQIRDQGYALGHEERINGIRTIAAPLKDRNGNVHGSIGVWGPTNRIDDQRFNEEIPQLLLETTNIIEIRMSYE